MTLSVFFSREGMFKLHWVYILGAYVAFNNVISHSVLQALKCILLVEPHEIEKYYYFYSSRKLKHRNKKELKLIQSSSLVLSLGV